ncbi:hypothetical protein [Microbacterium gorillae]|uniref:hypothetical protein n=1 Tax=Microbacterium gorillae TaxID=1231063 RepID=UPI003D97C6ED
MAFGGIDDWICECDACGEECVGRTPQQAAKFLREHREICNVLANQSIGGRE